MIPGEDSQQIALEMKRGQKRTRKKFLGPGSPETATNLSRPESPASNSLMTCAELVIPRIKPAVSSVTIAMLEFPSRKGISCLSGIGY
jgi:hypothetical protein